MRQRCDLWGAGGIDHNKTERELSNGFSVKDSPQEASVFVLLNGFEPSGSHHQVSCQNFNTQRFNLVRTSAFLCSVLCLRLDIYYIW